MKNRMGYLLSAAVLLAAEICIGLFAHDRFIRPYFGDVLVTVLLCCLCRVALPKFQPALPVFLFAVAVEFTQWLGLVKMLGLEGTVFAILLGTSFSWIDIICYGAGCLAFVAVEWLILKALPLRAG